MKSFRLVLCLLFAFVAGGAAQAQQKLPPIVQAAIAESKKACEPDKVTLEAGFVSEKDINGDGRVDYILDYGKFTCGSSATFFCGTGGCLTQVFASRADGSYVTALDENVRQIRFTRINNKPAIVLDLHGSACGKTGAEACPRTLTWDGKNFSR